MADVRVARELEDTESIGFRHQFKGWDNVLNIDYSKSIDTVSNKELQVKSDRTKAAADMSALFIPRQKIASEEDNQLLAEEWAEDLESMKCFVLEGKKFVHLPEEEKGQFYSQNCYVFVCRYLYAPELAEDEELDEDDENVEDEEEVIVYFWEGRDANQLGWLTFTFTLQKNLEKMFQDKLRIIRMKQQQEDEKFLSHFDGTFLIMHGKRFTKAEREAIVERKVVKGAEAKEPILLQTRTAGSIFTTRTVQARLRNH